MTFAEMKTMIGYLVADTDEKFVTDTKKGDAINSVTPAIAMETEDLFTRRIITPTQGLRRYSLWNDFLKMIAVYWNRDTGANIQFDKLEQVDYDRYEQLSYGRREEQNIPRFYHTEIGSVANTESPNIPGEIYIFPLPDSGASTSELHVHYMQKPTKLTAGTQITELAEQLHMAVVYRASMLMAYDQQDRVMANDFKRLYDKDIFEYRRHKHDLQLDNNPHMKDVMGYSNYGDPF